MSRKAHVPVDPCPGPPISSFGSATEILVRRTLNPPSRPGLLGRLGGYEVTGMIGAGGMGLVYRARNQDERPVAIKVLRPELALEPRVVRRFLREARGMQRLAHPNILPVLDVPDSPPPPCFVMPCIEPGSLALRIQSGQPLPTPPWPSD